MTVLSDEAGVQPAGEKGDCGLVDQLKTNGAEILVVDDEPIVLNFTATLLRREGYAVAEADSGEEALLAFKKNKSTVKTASDRCGHDRDHRSQACTRSTAIETRPEDFVHVGLLRLAPKRLAKV